MSNEKKADELVAVEQGGKSAPAKTDKAPAKKAKAKANKQRKGLGRRFKEIFSELKKVSWPTFPKIVKNTGIVLVVVLIFLIVIGLFDGLLAFLLGLVV